MPPEANVASARDDGEADAGRRSLASRAARPAIVVAAAAAYASTAPRWILGGDNGEFATLFATGGVAHPPGYPTMVLWLRAWHWLPVASAAYGAALATVVLGVAGVWAVQRACLAWGASVGATGLASAVYAFSPLAWTMACHAEVIAMNALFGAAIVALSAPYPRLTPHRRAVALGLVAGVALAAHQSIALLAPLGVLATMRAVREASRPWLAATTATLALLAGLAGPYLYVLFVARTADPRTTPMWIDAPTLGSLFFSMRRGTYGTLSLSSVPLASQPLANLEHLALGATRHLLGLPVVTLAALGVALRTRRHRTTDRRFAASLAALVGALVLAGPAFVASFNLPLEGAGPTVIQRFYLLPEVLVTVLAALSLDLLAPALMASEAPVAGLTLLAAVAAAASAASKVREHNRPSVALYIENTLRGAPPDAIVVGTGDHRWGGFMYARYVTHQRPDVLCVVPSMLAQAWYRHELESALHASFETPEHRAVGPRTLLARLLATGRPVLYTDWPAPAVEGTRHYSVGTLMRVLRDDERPPDAETLAALNASTFDAYALEPTVPEDPNGWGYGLQVDYARAWGELGQAFAREGATEKEDESYRRAARFAPWLVTGR
jgi:hypothetical protein